ncbi:EAL domain-containing protein, partial [Patescibacteria group bacterium]|nr:EAL domain-containing protein [Patescibacteria group bacterium]
QTEPHAYKSFFLRKENYSGNGRIAIVSCSKNGVARESHEFKNGVFTHFLLEGLKGDAKEHYKKENQNSDNSDITLSSLLSYLQVMVPNDQQPIRYGEEVGRIVLTSIKKQYSKYDEDEVYFKVPLKYASRKIHKNLGSIFLTNPIDNQLKFVDHLIDNIVETRDIYPNSVAQTVLNALKNIINAKYIYIEYFESKPGLESGKPKVIREIKYDTKREFLEHEINIEDSIFDKLIFLLNQDRDFFKRSKFGFIFPKENNGNNKSWNLFIPLQIKSDIKEYLIAIDINKNILRFGEIIGLSIKSIYKSTNEFTRLNISNLFNFIIDDIKRIYSFLPFDTYQRRFENFSHQLSDIVIYFEPVVHLGEKKISIDSWEALARDKYSEKVPKEIFDAAQQWGNDFTELLDIVLVEKAIRTFINLLPSEDRNKDYQRLSVNLYPSSILSDNFYLMLQKLIKENEIIYGKQLILEISEKKGIPEVVDDDEIGTKSIQIFKERIKKFTSELQVQFAIDDFGVGYSSILRLDKLELPYIKIDKDILRHTNPSSTIKYVKEYIAGSHPTQVILEGVDLDHRITIKEIHDLGIDYIQGHIVRKALPNLNEINEDTADLLKKLVTGTLKKANK